jgi:hypothetical protein
MWTRRGVLPVVIALIAVAALTAVPLSGPSAGPCPARTGGTVAASALVSPVSLNACRMAGVTVTNGTLAVDVPRDEGESVLAAGSGRGGHPAVLAVTRANGAVLAVAWPPDEDELAPRPQVSGIERLGRADANAPPTRGPAAPQPESGGRSTRCQDGAGTWLGMRWQGPYRWSLRTTGVPGYLGSIARVRDAIENAGQAVDDGRNDCGLDGGLGLKQRYVGESDRDANIRPNGACGQRDQRNIVAFGQLDGGLLALTCLWWSRGRTMEADVRVSDAPGMFTVDPDAGCTNQWDLQGTVTHEFGHVFGLGHVSYSAHGDLTMSDGLPACSSRFRALGLGDFETLRAQYGSD